MSREIKFRAWDKNGKIMRDWDYLKGIDYTHQFALFEDSNYEFMQYTGLKDKNGKEIYEGDIVHYQARHWDWNMEVVFDDGAFCLKRQGNFYEISTGIVNSCDTFEIIGNIYENPELLSTK